MKPGCSLNRDEAFIRTVSGTKVNPFNITPEAFDLEVLVNAAANICRFNGHIIRRYSVLAHSIWVAHRVQYRLKWDPTTSFKANLRIMRAALVHDLHEVFSLDVPTPYKNHFMGYRTFESDCKRASDIRFDVENLSPDEVKLISEVDFESYGLESFYLQDKDRFDWFVAQDGPSLEHGVRHFRRLLFMSDQYLIREFKEIYQGVCE